MDSPFLIHLISFETLHYHLLNSVFREFSLKAALLRPIHHCAVFDFYFDYWDFNFQRAGSYREREYEYYGGYSGDRSYYDSR